MKEAAHRQSYQLIQIECCYQQLEKDILHIDLDLFAGFKAKSKCFLNAFEWAVG